MTRIKRAKVSRHLMAVDTNILWHKDKEIVVSPEFDTFWDAHSDKFELSLVVPAIVRGELLFQQTMSALNSLRKANDSLADAAKVASATYKHRITEQRVRVDVERRLDDWIRRKKARIATVPYSSVNWANLVEAAIWRTGPFATETKSSEEEKGFRDALILETILGECKAVATDTRLAFICNDRLLRNATEERLAAHPFATAFESLNDFSSFLRLVDEQLTRQFVVDIQSKVRERFFNSTDPTCLYTANDVPARIQREHAAEFQWHGDGSGTTITPLLGASFLTPSPLQAWTAASTEVIWLNNPVFERLEGKHDFHWKSRVSWYQLFKSQRNSLLLGAQAARQERLRTLKFDVEWHSVVLANGRIKSAQIGGTAVVEKSWAETTDEALGRVRVVRTQEATGSST